MATVKEHYDGVLADVYSWMFGGFASGVTRNTDFFNTRGIRPVQSGVALDLGAGCGFQSIPLARLGFKVTAIDLSGPLLRELEGNAGSLPIETVEGDLTCFDDHVKETVELVVCMTDTVLHLPSREAVAVLFGKVAAALDDAGTLILTFRDLSGELTGVDRFIPVKSDEDTILTCFLEYGAETVTVHDLVHTNGQGGWTLKASCYEKLRLSGAWVHAQLEGAGFGSVDVTEEGGVVTVVARK
ncbi:class I SAM-dependent methyltransferase [Desulfoluna butyratoxydans]|uniref:S-adenosyl-l-methionine-dependent methyltransferase n=1 Tax=Desulfoluna butyratoxydans TaxID=231438 RepID=A0A4U8YQA4_9BACT|nr:class I SAM-dependent methyltransferase [Desulfoluna butyratoxydans]VFQ46455.1 s-adenosyl-l-methionine-dependent methyltransferase [Desulfoluna butyratoxydans]